MLTASVADPDQFGSEAGSGRFQKSDPDREDKNREDLPTLTTTVMLPALSS
jgi:hypothetical protein